MLELQVDLVDCLEAVGSSLVFTHKVDQSHHNVLGESAGCIGKKVLLRRFFGMKGKINTKES